MIPHKFLILVLMLLLICFVSSASATITNLITTPSVYLGETLTIRGTSDTNQILCQFIVIDDNGIAIERLSDEFSFADGSFYAERTISEPKYLRDQNYTINVRCGSSGDMNSAFLVLNRRPLDHVVSQEWLFVFSRENMDVFFIMGTFFLAALLAGLIGYAIFKSGWKFSGGR